VDRLRDQHAYHGLVFSSDFATAVDNSGTNLKFSRLERLLLGYLSSKPNRIVTRDALLNVLRGVGSDSYDRNIDYLLSRLRRKLGDSAKDPQFIRTLYGEGYMWIAQRDQSLAGNPGNDLYIAIKPSIGHPQNARDQQAANKIATDLSLQLQHSFDHRKPIEIVNGETCSASSQYLITLSFNQLNNTLNYALVVSHRQSGNILLSKFICTTNCSNDEDVASLSHKIKKAVVSYGLLRSNERYRIDSNPISTGIYDEASLFNHTTENLSEAEDALRLQLSEDPNDAACAVTLAVNLRSQLHSIDKEFDVAVFNEIEDLIFGSLNQIQDNCLYLAAAADELFNLGHGELANTLLNRALEIGPTYAACYLVAAKIAAYSGNLESSIETYNSCIELCEVDTLFYRHALSLKAYTYYVAGQYSEVRDIVPYILSHEPDPIRRAVIYVSFIEADIAYYKNEAMTICKQSSPEMIRSILTKLYYILAAPYSHQVNRVNLMRGAINLFVELHGTQCIPTCVKESIPSLFAQDQLPTSTEDQFTT